MHYGLQSADEPSPSECIIIGIFDNGDFSSCKHLLNDTQQHLLTKLSKRCQEAGDFIWQADAGNCSLMLIQCGKSESFDLTQLRKRMDTICNELLSKKISTATLCLPPMQSSNPDEQLNHMILFIDAKCYQLLDYKTIEKKPNVLESVSFFVEGANEETITAAKAIAEGVSLTRKLADLPANICTPTYLSQQASALSKQHKQVDVKTLGPEDMRKLGMGALLAVAQGSKEPPQLIEISYHGGKNEAPIVLVGKGITFDSGGLSLKPANAMDEMKYDMCGAASVIGTIHTCARLRLPINVVGLIASAENMPSGTAVKPGDIVTSMSGQTVEIINTDAEGRLVLADALTYAERFSPAFVIDIATLTGAIIVALGSVHSGFMTTDDALANDLLDASKTSGDGCWRMPLEEAYQKALNSPMADMLNAQFDRSAGSVTAACFLSRFTKKYRWAHLDIAGTAWQSGEKRQATGRPVPLLIQLIRNAISSR